MLNLANYGELKTAVESYTHREDLTDDIPTFISLAQARINRDLDILEMVERTTQSVSTRFVTLPTDTRKLLDVQIEISGGRKSLMPMSAAQMNTEHTDLITGEPNNYCIRGDELELQPAPGQAYTLELLYLYRFAAFSADADTNWLLTTHPNVYLYASMMEALIFIQGDERLKMFSTLYQTEIDALNEQAEEMALSGGPLQIMQLGTSTP